jgi:ornithine cyclodeaminase/alanine dehydrogenase
MAGDADAAPDRILYLSDADLKRLELGPENVLRALEDGLRASRGNAYAVPKVNLPIEPGHFFQAMPAAAGALGFALVKWVGVAAANAACGLPNVNAILVLSRLADGRPVALMAGERLTAMRTAAMTTAAARKLARGDSASIAFVGTGLQARSHLAALRLEFPALARVLMLGRSRATVAAFAEHVTAQGLEPVICTAPDQAVGGADIIVTSVPARAGLQPFLDGRHVRSGAFVSTVDLGRSWIADTICDFDVVATDDRAQSSELAADGKLAHAGPWAADLTELVDGSYPGRTDPAQRTAFVFAGTGLCDLAVAVEAYRQAIARGAGTSLEA